MTAKRWVVFSWLQHKYRGSELCFTNTHPTKPTHCKQLFKHSRLNGWLKLMKARKKISFKLLHVPKLKEYTRSMFGSSTRRNWHLSISLWVNFDELHSKFQQKYCWWKIQMKIFTFSSASKEIFRVEHDMDKLCHLEKKTRHRLKTTWTRRKEQFLRKKTQATDPTENIGFYRRRQFVRQVSVGPLSLQCNHSSNESWMDKTWPKVFTKHTFDGEHK